MKYLKKLRDRLPNIRLPNPKETVQELTVLGGFIMIMVGLWGFDYRIALIIGGIWLAIPPRGRRE